ncbi:MAG: hypothetical protein R3349_08385 [Geminicoccaceae bacterium]|nr:hypothetical protein [Geminicoccaceae bacterium]
MGGALGVVAEQGELPGVEPGDPAIAVPVALIIRAAGRRATRSQDDVDVIEVDVTVAVQVTVDVATGTNTRVIARGRLAIARRIAIPGRLTIPRNAVSKNDHLEVEWGRRLRRGRCSPPGTQQSKSFKTTRLQRGEVLLNNQPDAHGIDR